MKRWIVLWELGLAVLCSLCAVLSWRAARRTTEFPDTEDHPGFTAVRYVPPMLLLACALVILSGILLIDIAARIYSRSATRRPAATVDSFVA
ncbi:hypothetical protein ACFWU5_08615 [Nocardia sp. NPDC058640]|uniref:hypothetical protein n=1 Tax=Nocardia sp. NPDC058640 TaxID=3346571 RepID=UPI00364E7A1F